METASPHRAAPHPSAQLPLALWQAKDTELRLCVPTHVHARSHTHAHTALPGFTTSPWLGSATFPVGCAARPGGAGILQRVPPRRVKLLSGCGHPPRPASASSPQMIPRLRTSTLLSPLTASGHAAPAAGHPRAPSPPGNPACFLQSGPCPSRARPQHRGRSHSALLCVYLAFSSLGLLAS